MIICLLALFAQQLLDKEVAAHEGGALSVAIAPDGTRLATGGADGKIKLWNCATAELLQTLDADPKSVLALAWHPEGKLLASAGSAAKIVVWDAATKKPSRELTASPSIPFGSVAWSPDGKMLAAGDPASGKTLLWTWEGSAEPTLIEGGGQGMAFSPDGKILAIAAGKAVRLWSLGEKKILRSLEHFEVQKAPMEIDASCVAFSADGLRVAVPGKGGYALTWTLASGAAAQAYGPVADSITTMVFSPDRRHLYLGAPDGDVTAWPLLNANHPPIGYKQMKKPVRGLAVSRDGLFMSAVGDSGVVWFRRLN